MVSMLALSVIDCVFKPRLGQTDGYKIGICCFSAALKSKSKDWSTQNQDNVFESDYCFNELACGYSSKGDIIISLNVTCSRHDIDEK